MKKLFKILATALGAVVLFSLIWFYVVCIMPHKITNAHLVSVSRLNYNHIKVMLCESAEYFDHVKTYADNNGILYLTFYTTTLLNPFERKKLTEEVITINDSITAIKYCDSMYALVGLDFRSSYDSGCPYSNKPLPGKYFFKKKCSHSLNTYHLVYIGDTIHDEEIYYYLDLQDKFKLLPEVKKLKMIAELLTYKGDTSLCCLPANTTYNPAWNQSPITNSKYYSIQLESLFIINMIYYDDAFNRHPIPGLLNSDTHVSYTIAGAGLDEAYNEYNKWFNQLKTIGFKKMREKDMDPLTGKVDWF